jgi:hypothetical protein
MEGQFVNGDSNFWEYVLANQIVVRILAAPSHFLGFDDNSIQLLTRGKRKKAALSPFSPPEGPILSEAIHPMAPPRRCECAVPGDDG